MFVYWLQGLCHTPRHIFPLNSCHTYSRQKQVEVRPSICFKHTKQHDNVSSGKRFMLTFKLLTCLCVNNRCSTCHLWFCVFRYLPQQNRLLIERYGNQRIGNRALLMPLYTCNSEVPYVYKYVAKLVINHAFVFVNDVAILQVCFASFVKLCAPKIMTNLKPNSLPSI